MSPDDWLEIVAWLESQKLRITADVAAKYGVALKGYPTEQVSAAVGRLVANRQSITLAGIKREIRAKTSRWRAPLEKRHRELFPRGCGSPICDLCLTSEPERRNVVLHD